MAFQTQPAVFPDDSTVYCRVPVPVFEGVVEGVNTRDVLAEREVIGLQVTVGVGRVTVKVTGLAEAAAYEVVAAADGVSVQVGSANSSSCAGNVVTGNLQLQQNTGSLLVFDNTVTGNLQCQNNSSISGMGNTAKQKQGQCTGF